MKIKMVKDVRSDIPYLSTRRTELRAGKIYEATANKNGAVSGICDKGELIGVRPGEFEFVELPRWLYEKWAPVFQWSVKDAIIKEDDHGST